MKLFVPAAIVLMTASMALPARAGDVKLQVANGRVTLQARDATLREILSEWARVGQVKIVNAEKVMGVPVTLDLVSVSEADALNILLRSVSGYMAAPKAQLVADASIYDRIVILATPRSAAVNTGFSPAPAPQRMPSGMPNPVMLDDQDDPAGPPPTYPGNPPAYRGMGQPQPAGVNPPVPGSVPQGAPGTVSPLPQMLGQPGAPGAIQPNTGPAGTVAPPKKPGGPGGDSGGN